jgi:hypothetical protein
MAAIVSAAFRKSDYRPGKQRVIDDEFDGLRDIAVHMKSASHRGSPSLEVQSHPLPFGVAQNV